MKIKYTVTITDNTSRVIDTIEIVHGSRPDPNDFHDDNVYEDEFDVAVDAFKDRISQIMK